MREEKLDAFFDFIISAEDTPRHKPFPDPYLLALEKAGAAAKNVIALEDSPSGIESAGKAGIEVIEFKGSFEDISLDTYETERGNI